MRVLQLFLNSQRIFHFVSLCKDNKYVESIAVMFNNDVEYVDIHVYMRLDVEIS